MKIEKNYLRFIPRCWCRDVPLFNYYWICLTLWKKKNSQFIFDQFFLLSWFLFDTIFISINKLFTFKIWAPLTFLFNFLKQIFLLFLRLFQNCWLINAVVRLPFFRLFSCSREEKKNVQNLNSLFVIRWWWSVVHCVIPQIGSTIKGGTNCYSGNTMTITVFAIS